MNINIHIHCDQCHVHNVGIEIFWTTKLSRCYSQSLCIIDDCLCIAQACFEIMFLWHSPISPFMSMMTNQVWGNKGLFMSNELHETGCQLTMRLLCDLRQTCQRDIFLGHPGGPDCIQSMLSCNIHSTMIPVIPKLLCKIPVNLVLMKIENFHECLTIGILFQHSVI